VLERDTLLRLALPFFLDPRVVVTGGVVRPSNGCAVERGRVLATGVPRSHLARFQVIEYLRGMLAGRMGWNRLDSLFIVSGALGLFSREAVMAAGGYRTDTLGEDMELVMRLQRWAARKGRRHVVRFVSSAVAWTEVPERLAALGRQRARWHQGLAESLWMNRAILTRESFTPARGLAFVAQLLVELLGPLVELVGALLLVALLLAGGPKLPYGMLYTAVWIFGGTINSLLGVALELMVCPRYRRPLHLAALLGYALLENLGYRQLMGWYRLQGPVAGAAAPRQLGGDGAARARRPGGAGGAGAAGSGLSLRRPSGSERAARAEQQQPHRHHHARDRDRNPHRLVPPAMGRDQEQQVHGAEARRPAHQREQPHVVCEVPDAEGQQERADPAAPVVGRQPGRGEQHHQGRRLAALLGGEQPRMIAEEGERRRELRMALAGGDAQDGADVHHDHRLQPSHRDGERDHRPAAAAGRPPPLLRQRHAHDGTLRARRSASAARSASAGSVLRTSSRVRPARRAAKTPYGM
jgi:hypothetical protein